ncbi:MAG: cysteine--tRNA ligase [bacterium]
MKLFNTLGQKLEDFQPVEANFVRIYTCGPTVYDIPHIGNLRKYICDDLLYRTLIFNHFDVTRVMNITDVDDKTIKKSQGDRQKFDQLIKDYEKAFFVDLDKLNIVKPDKENITRATEYIDKMVDFITDLMTKGFAYRTEDGSIYFSLDKFKHYGKLSQLENREIKVGARVSQDEYEKENPSDFALWKAWDENDGEIFWETSLGKGRPGWHIECSTMSMDRLGDTIDIHTGGIDNIFPHHENEIAQSEARSGKKFVNYWIHNGHLMVDNKKMSKSEGTTYTLEMLEERGFSPLDFRYMVISAHYRSKLNFTWDSLQAAKNARERLVRFGQDLPVANGAIHIESLRRFKDALDNDLNAPEALAVLWEVVREENIKPNDKYATLSKFDEVLGLKILAKKNQYIGEDIIEIAEERKRARIAHDFTSSDYLRQKLSENGWEIEDKADNAYLLIKKNESKN